VNRRKKQAQQNIEPLSSKKPRGSALADNVEKSHFMWDTKQAEFDGLFSWKGCSHETLLTEVIPKLQACQSISWESLGQNGSHQVSTNQLCKEAFARLKEHIDPDGNIDRLYSLRLSGKQRIWGFRDRHMLCILWWDPEHRVCPSQLKNT